MMMRLALWLGLCVCGLPLSSALHAQDKPRAAAAKRHKPAAAAKRKAADKAASTPSAEAPPKAAAHSETAAPTATAPKPPPVVDADEDVHKEGGTEVKTLEFGGLDIEGQLKTPQMLYFLNRLRAEFERPQLPHRSFMPELQRSTKENAF